MLQRVQKRSRGGCLGCKKNKKKCDEIKPICSACLKLCKICQYQVTPRNSHGSSYSGKQQLRTGNEILNRMLEILKSNCPSEYGVPLDDESLNVFELFQNQTFLPHKGSHIRPPADIDDAGLTYLEFFCRSVLPESYMLPENGNFCRYFLPMAMSDKGILYSLIAWGCRAMKSQGLDYRIEDAEAEYYIEKVQLLHAKGNGFQSRDEFVATIGCSMILVCMKISFGDTDGWSDFFTRCFNIINCVPGSFEYLKQECSIEGHALAESFAYYDVLASQSNENGTFFSIEEYKDLLAPKSLCHNVHQGFLRPIICLIGETVSLLVEYNSLRASFDFPECDKLEVLSTIIERANAIDKQIEFTKLGGSYLKQLKFVHEDEVEELLTLFELYQLSARIYVRQVIKKLPSVVPEIEVLFFALKQDLCFLVKAKRLKNILGFPMLIAGVSAISKEDRNDVKNMFARLIQTCGYTSGYQKLWIVIQKIWNMNQNGTSYVDWFKITKDMDWKLNLGR